MEQKNYTPRHAASGAHERSGHAGITTEHVPVRDPELEQQIARYQARRRKKKKQQRRILRYALVVTLVALFALTVVMLTTGHKDALKGIWALDSTTVYEFDGKGGGALVLPLNTYDFSYTAEDGTLAIDFIDPSAFDAVYRYSVKGSTLTLDTDSMTFTLEKCK